MQVVVHMRPAWKGPECGGFDFGIGFLQERVALRYDAVGDESGRNDEPGAGGVPEVAAGPDALRHPQRVAEGGCIVGSFETV